MGPETDAVALAGDACGSGFGAAASFVTTTTVGAEGVAERVALVVVADDDDDDAEEEAVMEDRWLIFSATGSSFDSICATNSAASRIERSIEI